MSEKLVSVVIPTYKRPDMLERAIRSVLNQTYKNIEIIIVDDNGCGSEMQRETEKVASRFGTSITYLVHENNKGGSAARNTGWKKASGEYITFLDDDDEISATKIEKQVARLENLDESYGACYTAYHVLMQNGAVQKSGTTREGNVYLQALARTFYMGSGSNLLIRKKMVDRINGYDEEFKRNQDIEFMARLFEFCKVAFVDEDLLTIHMEVRQFRHPFEFFEDITDFYLDKMRNRIDALTKREKKKVLSIIMLERARVAWTYKEKKVAVRYMLKVNFIYVIKYMFYLTKRVLTKRSYGFEG